MRSTYNSVVTAAMLLFLGHLPGQGMANDLDELFRQLADPSTTNWEMVERDIEIQLGLSGSASADLLLRLGQQALEEDDVAAALDHLTALTDHAPDFAEGWNTRAAAYFLAGRIGPALNDLRHVLVIEPRHYAALAGIGAIMEEIGDPEAALAAYRAAFAIHPHRADLHDAIIRLELATEGTAL